MAVTVGVAGAAWAQAQPQPGRFAVDRFEPAGAGSDWFTLESLDFRGHLRFGANVTGRMGEPAAGDLRSVGQRSGAAGAQPGRGARRGRAGAVGAGPAGRELPGGAACRAATAGSWRAKPTRRRRGVRRSAICGWEWTFVCSGAPTIAVTAAAGIQVFAATGNVDGYTSDGHTRFWPRLSIAGERGVFAWAARAGYQARPSGGLAPGDEVTRRAGGGLARLADGAAGDGVDGQQQAVGVRQGRHDAGGASVRRSRCRRARLADRGGRRPRPHRGRRFSHRSSARLRRLLAGHRGEEPGSAGRRRARARAPATRTGAEAAGRTGARTATASASAARRGRRRHPGCR